MSCECDSDILDHCIRSVIDGNYLPPVFEKRREVLFWGPSPSPPYLPYPWMFCFISRLLLKLAF